MKRLMWMIILCSLAGVHAQAAQRYAVTGMVLKVDRPHRTMLVSCNSIPGYMEAMAMPFTVLEAKMLDGLQPGTTIEFTLVLEKDSSHVEEVHVRPFESLELDPTQARRLKLLETMVTPPSPATSVLNVGQPVPDFTLTDQNRRLVTLSQLAGKVVAVNFIYTRCPFPDYCFRLSNNFGQLQKRFGKRMGRDLVLLSVVIDPAHDGPAALTKYASVWKANPEAWHFLTGSLPEIQQLCRKFDMNFYPDEAVLVHSFHTVVIDRHTKLAANIEGNDFTPEQLGDLVETLLDKKN